MNLLGEEEGLDDGLSRATKTRLPDQCVTSPS